MFFSPSENGFYHPAIHGANLPSDAVEISADCHAALMAGQAAGQVISPGADGMPALHDRPTPTMTDVQARATRDALLAATDWTQLVDVPAATRDAYVVYRQALRNVTTQAGFPDSVEWPVQPAEEQAGRVAP